jgi:hypothetical protein
MGTAASTAAKGGATTRYGAHSARGAGARALPDARVRADDLTNHVHLLPTPEQAERVSQVLISAGRRDVQYVNRTDGDTGTL